MTCAWSTVTVAPGSPIAACTASANDVQSGTTRAKCSGRTGTIVWLRAAARCRWSGTVTTSPFHATALATGRPLPGPVDRQPVAEPCVHLGDPLGSQQDCAPGFRGPLLDAEDEAVLRVARVL